MTWKRGDGLGGDYIKLKRNILEWEWWEDFNTTRLFIYMLLKANWKDGKFKGIDVPRGSFVSSIAKLSDGTGLSTDEVRTAIEHLVNSNTITKQSTNRFTLFSVVNYGLHQDISQATDQAEPKQAPSKSQAIPNPFPTIEEKKEEKEGKKERRKEALKEKNTKKEFFPDDAELNQTFADYVDMRKKIKAPMTDRAVDMAITKLNELSGNNRDVAIRILEQSIMNSWKGLFPLKEQEKQQTGQSFEDMWRNA